MVEPHRHEGERGGREPATARGGPATARGGPWLHCPQPHSAPPSPGVFICRGKEDALVTKNLVPGESVYGEKRVSISVSPGPLSKVPGPSWQHCLLSSLLAMVSYTGRLGEVLMYKAGCGFIAAAVASSPSQFPGLVSQLHPKLFPCPLSGQALPAPSDEAVSSPSLSKRSSLPQP